MKAAISIENHCTFSMYNWEILHTKSDKRECAIAIDLATKEVWGWLTHSPPREIRVKCIGIPLAFALFCPLRLVTRVALLAFGYWIYEGIHIAKERASDQATLSQIALQILLQFGKELLRTATLPLSLPLIVLSGAWGLYNPFDGLRLIFEVQRLWMLDYFPKINPESNRTRYMIIQVIGPCVCPVSCFDPEWVRKQKENDWKKALRHGRMDLRELPECSDEVLYRYIFSKYPKVGGSSLEVPTTQTTLENVSSTLITPSDDKERG